MTDKMDYQFKDFDKTAWKNYTSWLCLSSLPKFRYDLQDTNSNHTALSTDVSDALEGMVILNDDKASISSVTIPLVIQNTSKQGKS